MLLVGPEDVLVQNRPEQAQKPERHGVELRTLPKGPAEQRSIPSCVAPARSCSRFFLEDEAFVGGAGGVGEFSKFIACDNDEKIVK